MEVAVHVLAYATIDAALIQEVKVMDGVYMWRATGYQIVEIAAESHHCVGVTLI